MTQQDLNRSLKLNGRYVSNYERLTYKTLSRGKAELFAEYFKEKLKSKGIYNLTNEHLIKNFLETKEAMFIHKRSAFKFIPTQQEKQISDVLDHLKEHGLEVTPNHDIISGKGTINVDFLISKKGMPKVVVECTTTESPGKKYSYNLKRKIYETDYRFTKIKIKYPKIKTVFILSLPKNDLWEYRLRKLINMQTLSIDVRV